MSKVAGNFIMESNNDNKNSRQIKAIWKKIYKYWFGLKKDFSNLQVPDYYDPKKHFVVIVSQNLSIRETAIAIEKKFDVSSDCEGLDKYVHHNDRDTKNGDYVVLFNKNVQADKEFKNLSANDLEKTNHKGITLLERLLLEILYFDKTQQHLDIFINTLCSGSTRPFYSVPSVGWDYDRNQLHIGWYERYYSYDNLRSRAVVSQS